MYAKVHEGPTLSHRIADYLHGESFDTIDPAATARMKHLLAYHVGLAFRAQRLKDKDAAQAVAVARELSGNAGDTTIIGQAGAVTPVDAAMTNCTLMRSQGLDDVIFPAGIHAGLMTIPVALAIGEREHISGKELLTACVLGYEIMGKFGSFTWALENARRPTQPFGAFGAVVTGARALGLNAERMSAALAYAAHTAMGLAEGDGMVTHWYSLVCRNGLTGAYMAKHGGWGSPTVLEGQWGFLDMFVGLNHNFDGEALLASLGSPYAVTKACEKRYPGTALNQVPIELARGLVTKHGIKAANVEGVKISLPQERKNLVSAQFRGPFLIPAHASSTVTFHVAIVLLDTETRWERFNEINNPEILALIDKIDVDMIEGKPIRYAKVEIRTKDGKSYTAEGDEFYHPAEPVGDILEREASGILPKQKIDRFSELYEQLETLDDVSEMVKCLRL